MIAIFPLSLDMTQASFLDMRRRSASTRRFEIFDGGRWPARVTRAGSFFRWPAKSGSFANKGVYGKYERHLFGKQMSDRLQELAVFVTPAENGRLCLFV